MQFSSSLFSLCSTMDIVTLHVGESLTVALARSFKVVYIVSFSSSIFHSNDHLFEHSGKTIWGEKYIKSYKVINDDGAQRYWLPRMLYRLGRGFYYNFCQLQYVFILSFCCGHSCIRHSNFRNQILLVTLRYFWDADVICKEPKGNHFSAQVHF